MEVKKLKDDIRKLTPRCSERAFQEYVTGRVQEALEQERAIHQQYLKTLTKSFDIEREIWRSKLAAENTMLNAVLKKYDISIADAKNATLEFTTIEHHPSYTSFLKIAQRASIASRSSSS